MIYFIRSFGFIFLNFMFTVSQFGIASSRDVVIAFSDDSINVTRNFKGVNITIFGNIESTLQDIRVLLDQESDFNKKKKLVIVVRGPGQDFRILHKVKKDGFLFVEDEFIIKNIPSVFGILSTHKLSRISDKKTLLEKKIGLESLLGFQKFDQNLLNIRRFNIFESEGEELGVTTAFKIREALRKAQVEQMAKQGLYFEDIRQVEFFGNKKSLFKAKFFLPDFAPPGEYLVEVHLFYRGDLVASGSNNFRIKLVGLPSFLANLADNEPFKYGFLPYCCAL